CALRGSRILGNKIGYCVPRMRTVGLPETETAIASWYAVAPWIPPRIWFGEGGGEAVLLADDDRVPSRSAFGRRAVPPDRAAGQGGAPARRARRGRPAPDRA